MEVINYIKGKKQAYAKLPRTCGKIKSNDPYVYLDEEDCLIWMTTDGLQYMNCYGQVGGVVDIDLRIKERLGKFRGLAIEKVNDAW